MKTAAIAASETVVWSVYILRCGNGALYTGVTTDVPRRVREHQSGGRRAARFTRAFAPVELAYHCPIGTKRMACRIEYRIKQLPREKKEWIVSRNVSMERLIKWLDD